MYEDQTSQAILQRMLDQVPNDIDKREGSIIYDALAPAAMELAQMYAELDINMNLAFAGTSSGEYLERRAQEFGITRKPATRAKRKALFYDSQNALFDIPIGSRFSISGLNYVAIEKTNVGEFVMECETAGEIGNQYFGSLLPIDFITGLAKAELTDIITPGTDTETVESLRLRLLDKVQLPATSGNAAQYRLWAREVPGIKDAKVFPLHAGPGTVKVSLLSAAGRAPTTEKVNEVSSYIEALRPIGAGVTYSPCTEVGINVTASLVLATGADIETIKTAYSEALTQIFATSAFLTDTVRYSRVASLFLEIPGVQDWQELTVNGGTANVPLGADGVPVVGVVTLNAI